MIFLTNQSSYLCLTRNGVTAPTGSLLYLYGWLVIAHGMASESEKDPVADPAGWPKSGKLVCMSVLVCQSVRRYTHARACVYLPWYVYIKHMGKGRERGTHLGCVSIWVRHLFVTMLEEHCCQLVHWQYSASIPWVPALLQALIYKVHVAFTWFCGKSPAGRVWFERQSLSSTRASSSEISHNGRKLLVVSMLK